MFCWCTSCREWDHKVRPGQLRVIDTSRPKTSGQSFSRYSAFGISLAIKKILSTKPKFHFKKF